MKPSPPSGARPYRAQSPTPQPPPGTPPQPPPDPDRPRPVEEPPDPVPVPPAEPPPPRRGPAGKSGDVKRRSAAPAYRAYNPRPARLSPATPRTISASDNSFPAPAGSPNHQMPIAATTAVPTPDHTA